MIFNSVVYYMEYVSSVGQACDLLSTLLLNEYIANVACNTFLSACP